MTVIYLDYLTTDVSRQLIYKLQCIYHQNILDAFNIYKDTIHEESFSSFHFNVNQNLYSMPSQKRIITKSINRSIRYYFKLYKDYIRKEMIELIEDPFLVFSVNQCTISEGNPVYILMPELGLTLSTNFDLKSVITNNCKILLNSKQLIIEIENDNTIVSH